MTSLVCSDPSKMVCSDPPTLKGSLQTILGGSLQTILEGSLQTKEVIDGAGCMPLVCMPLVCRPMLCLWFFRKTEFYDLIHTFLDLKQLFLIFPPNFPNGVSIFTLVDIGRAKSEKIVSTKPSYQFDLYMAVL